MDIRETVINDVLCKMSPSLDAVKLQMLEMAVRDALHGFQIEKICTELSTGLDDTEYMIHCFLANKQIEGCSSGTIDQYGRTARHFFTTVNKGYRDITKDDLIYYLGMRKRTVSPNTLVREKRSLSSLFTWLNDEGIINANPVKAIKGIREEDVEFLYFTIEEEVEIRSVQTNIRDMAIIAFLFSTGVRVGEIEMMDRKSVDMSNGSVTFRGEKTRKGKFRTVYLDAWARKYLSEYMRTRDDSNPALFVTDRKYGGQPKRLNKRAYERITRQVCEEAGIYGKGTVHTFRRTFATRLAEHGCSLQMVQELVGHADIKTTNKHYVGKSQKNVHDAWEKYTYAA